MNVACSICLEPFTLPFDIYTTPCGHVFHYECIRKWLQSGNNHCSQCRQDCTIDEIVKLYFSEKESALKIITCVHNLNRRIKNCSKKSML